MSEDEYPFKVADDIEYINSDVYENIKCPCGNYLVFSESGVEKQCTCGRVYKLVEHIEVHE